MTEIGKNIADKRKELGLTQKELADLMGYKSVSTIAKIEAGVNDIPQAKVAQFARMLGTTPEYLAGWVNTERVPVCDKLRSLRNAKGISMEALAKRVGTTRQTIFKYENGIITNIPADRIEKIAKALDVHPAYLMGFTNDSHYGKEEKRPATNDGSELYEKKKRFADKVMQMSDAEFDRLEKVLALIEGSSSKV